MQFTSGPAPDVVIRDVPQVGVLNNGDMPVLVCDGLMHMQEARFSIGLFLPALPAVIAAASESGSACVDALRRRDGTELPATALAIPCSTAEARTTPEGALLVSLGSGFGPSLLALLPRDAAARLAASIEAALRQG
jgi:hypothetical protein